VEGPASKSTPEGPMMTGRTDGNKRVVIPAIHGIQAMRDQYDDSTIGEFDRIVNEHLRNLESATAANARKLSSSSIIDSSPLEGSPSDDLVAQLSGRYVIVKVISAQSSTLKAVPVAFSNLLNYQKFHDFLRTER
jgi:hypothetical protein